jgi:hypothetical protein
MKPFKCQTRKYQDQWQLAEVVKHMEKSIKKQIPVMNQGPTKQNYKKLCKSVKNTA